MWCLPVFSDMQVFFFEDNYLRSVTCSTVMDNRENEFRDEENRYMARTASYVLLPEAMLYRSNEEPEKTGVFGFVERVFKVSERGSTWKTEIKAGFFNFVATSYQLVLVPQILHQGPHSLPQIYYFNAYVLAIGATSVVAGLSSNLPVSLGFGIGCCALFVPLLQHSPDSSHDALRIELTRQVCYRPTNLIRVC